MDANTAALNAHENATYHYERFCDAHEEEALDYLQTAGIEATETAVDNLLSQWWHEQ